MSFNGTCPMCGFSTYQTASPLSQLKSLHGQRSERAQNALKAVSDLIADNIPSDAKLGLKLKFMYKISKVGDEELVRGCEQYINSTHWQQGKGWNYLAAIVVNIGQNSKKIAENERKRIGSGPPKRSLPK